MTCQEKLEALGLEPNRATAALHYLADHLAGQLQAPPDALELFHHAYRAAVRDCCDELRHQAGDHVKTVDFYPLKQTAA